MGKGANAPYLGSKTALELNLKPICVCSCVSIFVGVGREKSLDYYSELFWQKNLDSSLREGRVIVRNEIIGFLDIYLEPYTVFSLMIRE